MLELPETITLARQASVLTGKRVARVRPPSSPHRFTWFTGDPAGYDGLLSGRAFIGARSAGSFADLLLEGALVTVNDGVCVRYLAPGAPRPAKYQLLIELEGGDALAFTVQMYGGILAGTAPPDSDYYALSVNSVSPLSDAFTPSCFLSRVTGLAKDYSAKALLATEQRFPGVGNGVLQDILFQAGVHPKRKASTLTEDEFLSLHAAMRRVLAEMAERGGRDTERDLYGRPGGYVTRMSRQGLERPCPRCGGAVTREAYLGGAVYYCPVCQPLK